LAERKLPKLEVAGSIPVARSIVMNKEQWCYMRAIKFGFHKGGAN
jgi:hypothetical protein